MYLTDILLVFISYQHPTQRNKPYLKNSRLALNQNAMLILLTIIHNHFDITIYNSIVFNQF